MVNITWASQGGLSAAQVAAVAAVETTVVATLNAALARPIHWDVQFIVDPTLVGSSAIAMGTGNTAYWRNDGAKLVYGTVGQLETVTGIEHAGFDARIILNPGYMSQLWWDATPNGSGPVPSNMFSAYSVLLHETLHGLVMGGWTNSAGTNPYVAESTYDTLIRNYGGRLYLDGANVDAVHGGPVPLQAGSPFHFSTDVPDVMGPYARYGVRQTLSDLDLAMLADNGIGTIRGDRLTGTTGDDDIAAGGGDDIVTGGQGNDRIDGGTGFNTANFSSSSAAYHVTVGSTVTVMDRLGTDGTDTLVNVQALHFSDFTVDTVSLGRLATAPHATIDPLTEVYIATFDRAPDTLGLAYWVGRLTDGMSLEAIARSFFVQPETTAKYPPATTAGDFVTAVYGNVLGRAPDALGYDYWVNQLTGGTMSRDKFVIAMINGAHANSGATADIAYLSNKVAVGEHFALARGLNDGAWATQVMAGVDATTASVDAANRMTDSFATSADARATSHLVVEIVGLAP